MTESFEDAIKALRHIARGNGAVMRIADRIVAAHERETKVEGVCGPITGELRDAMCQWGWDAEQTLAISGSDFIQLCDAIDSIHAQLERENAALKAELNRVLGEQEEHAHTRGESITGELREVAAKTECANGRCEKLYRGDLERVADRIDAEHERQLGVLYRDMSDAEWVRLPVDADGVPIHIGDVMVYADGNTCPLPVVALVPPAVFLTDEGPRYADMCRHQPDTWERIIEDALDGYHDTDFEKLVSRCKALAGDAE